MRVSLQELVISKKDTFLTLLDHYKNDGLIGVYPKKSPKIELSIAIHAHLYYASYIPALVNGVKNFPDASVFVSVTDESTKNKVINALSSRQKYRVEVVPNKGRNFAPLLLSFSEELSKFDLVIHIHSKASYGSFKRKQWAQSLWKNLFLNRRQINKALEFFEQDENVGLYFPIDFRWMPKVLNWDRSEHQAIKNFPEYKSQIESHSKLIYPIGGMFWTRTKNLQLISKNINKWDMFPEEKDNQKEVSSGTTLEHSLERFISVANEINGFTSIIYSSKGRKFLNSYPSESE
jgi:lipopolysaccharide biosynthesis protein